MLKDITVVDFQGNERKAQARYLEVKSSSAFQSPQIQSIRVESILVKGEIIYPTLDWVFNSMDGNSYYIK
ncbi:MAG TPA: hypothetical protein DD639_03535 [Acinetobacter sp.]|uniref:hypothetical protein n=1 Tax=Acinetobacter venetianus TaxID=52133 RepID=UPI000775A1C8|nr:hypothetical protein [Acinetobacter venetianus]KXO82761.1 hypothetical protein AYL20_01850 [Acinetobacter venetianus]KXO86258.1 hypothetical protein AYK86_14945 [Acinetobacter venetianus]HBO71427.1 hypothetical protein [Acinetobacter sp.]